MKKLWILFWTEFNKNSEWAKVYNAVESMTFSRVTTKLRLPGVPKQIQIWYNFQLNQEQS